MSSILVWNYDNAVVYTFGRYSLHMRSNIYKDFITVYNLKEVHNFHKFLSIRTKTQRCTPLICALFFCRLIRTLQCLHWKIQPGYEVEHFHLRNVCFGKYSLDKRLNIFLDFIKCYKFTKGGHFYNFSLIRTKVQRCTPSICARSICESIRTLQRML